MSLASPLEKRLKERYSVELKTTILSIEEPDTSEIFDFENHNNGLIINISESGCLLVTSYPIDYNISDLLILNLKSLKTDKLLSLESEVVRMETLESDEYIYGYGLKFIESEKLKKFIINEIEHIKNSRK